MANEEFIDYYELLELSSNANLETIERVFRYLATKWHPDAGESGDKEKFSLLVKAFETLRDPELRAAYDAKYQQQQVAAAKIVKNAAAVGGDTLDRRKLLSLYYAKRRQDMKNPGLGIATVEHLMQCPTEVLEFHLWYFREKGWIKREENGGVAITADGVDRIESTELKQSNGDERYIEWQPGVGGGKKELVGNL